MLMITAQKGFCLVDVMSPELSESLKVNSHEPNFMTIAFSLLFVVSLIYITGIIYSKLNIVGAKTLKDQLKNAELNRAMIVSTTQLGQNKNLHVVELNEKKYLIGATANSISLIKELESNVPRIEIVEKPKNNEEEILDKAIKVLYSGSRAKSVGMDRREREEFSLHKKYL